MFMWNLLGLVKIKCVYQINAFFLIAENLYCGIDLCTGNIGYLFIIYSFNCDLYLIYIMYIEVDLLIALRFEIPLFILLDCRHLVIAFIKRLDGTLLHNLMSNLLPNCEQVDWVTLTSCHY